MPHMLLYGQRFQGLSTHSLKIYLMILFQCASSMQTQDTVQVQVITDIKTLIEPHGEDVGSHPVSEVQEQIGHKERSAITVE